MFLFGDGSLTLMNRASLIALVRFWSCSSHYSKIVDVDIVTCGVTVVKYRGRGLLMFLEPFCKISGRFSNVFFITPIFTVFISIYDSTFVCDRILVLGSHKEASDGLSSFKEHLNPKFVVCPLYSLTKSLMVWDYHVQVCFVIVLASLGSSCFVLVWVLALHSCPFNGPCELFASCESFEEVFFFFLQQLGGEANCRCSMV